MIKIITKGKTTAGTRNITNGMPNQDFILTCEDENIVTVSVNDGCTNCEQPTLAAELNAKAIQKAAKKSSVWSMPEKKFKQYMNECFNEIFSNTDFCYKELCSTTAFVIINKATGAYRAFSVGDTAILAYSKDGQFRQLLEPVNAFRKSSTYFTNDSFSVKKFGQFRQGTMNGDTAGFVIYSDGAENIACKPYTAVKRLVSSAYVSDELYKAEEEKIFNNLGEETDDDISIVFTGIESDEISCKMQEFYRLFSPADTAVKPAEVKAEQPEKSENSELIKFISVYPRTAEEIFRSDLIEENKIVCVLAELVRKGVVSCKDGKFSAG